MESSFNRPIYFSFITKSGCFKGIGWHRFKKRYIFVYVHLKADCGTDGIKSPMFHLHFESELSKCQVTVDI